MTIHDRPIVVHCAVCNRSVEEINVERDDRIRAWLIKVKCHSEEDNAQINDEDLVHLGPRCNPITCTAFKTPRLTAAAAPQPTAPASDAPPSSPP